VNTQGSPIESPFGLRREDEGDVAVIVVAGDVDVATAPELRAALRSLPPGSQVVVDLCETRFMDSSGLAVLLAEHVDSDRDLRVACEPSGPIRRLFDLSMTGDRLPVHASRAEALAAF
jgi:anti-sigma B factor antagonist